MMPGQLASMTGYASAGGAVGEVRFALEVKSVNNRGLDLRLRLAPGFDALESELRQRAAAALERGSVTLTLNVEREGATTEVVVDSRALSVVISALEALAPRVDAQPPRLDGILGLKGVLVERQHALDPDAEAALHAAILGAAEECLAGLVAARRGEGAHLGEIVGQRLDEIAALVAAAEAHPARTREVILARLRAQLEALREAGAGLSEDRLAQEALLLATKADIREELDRLTAHVAAARALLAKGGAVGRRLDFLSQEFNREANTLCSKANDVGLTAIGLDLKATIDQLREQIQNLE
jgi:uncharacterized protein (TIGR00255 family)